MFMKLLVLLREKAMVLEDERDQKECMTLWVVVIDILSIRCEFVLHRTHGGDSAVESSAAWLV